MKIAIVGSQGFIGKSILISNKFKSDELVLFNSKQSIWEDREVLKSDFLDCESIIWTAGRVNPYLAEYRPDLVELEELEFSKMLENLIKGHGASYKKFIFLSSAGCTYSDTLPPYKEKDKSFGINQYGKMKIRLEKVLVSALPNSTIVRLANIYGPLQQPGKGQGVIAEWIEAIRLGKGLTVFGDLNSSRDYLHIDDVISAIKLINLSDVNEIINIGSGVETTLGCITKLFSSYSPIKIDFEFGDRRNFDRSTYWLSIDRAKLELNWEPKIDIRDGIKSLLSSQLILGKN
jgi:UDP-glucose 4-epimerase